MIKNLFITLAMANSGDSSAVMWVAVASAEGIPILNPEE